MGVSLCLFMMGIVSVVMVIVSVVMVREGRCGCKPMSVYDGDSVCL